ncbi:Dip2/Utp12 protein [Chamberlinius hualienensis]
MGLTKQYLRYESRGFFNVVASAKCNILFLTRKGVHGRYAAVGACENVFVWDTRQGEKVLTLRGENSEVCVIAKSPKQTHIAAGYRDGSIKVFDLLAGEDAIVTFHGHKSPITCLAYDESGLRLLSGSMDTEVVLWDIVNESGVFRLKGHKGVVTQCHFLNSNTAVTSSLDSTIKFWDLDIQHCFKTMVGHRCDVCDFVLLDEGKRMVTGSADQLLRGWSLNFDADETGVSDEKRLKVSENVDEVEEDESCQLSCSSIGSIARHSRSRLKKLTVDWNQKVLACNGSDFIVEFFTFLSKEELKKKLAKMAKKARKRSLKSSEAEAELTQDVGLELKDEIQRLGFIKFTSRVKSFDVYSDQTNVIKLIALLSNNSLEMYEFSLSAEKLPEKPKSKLTLPGHQTDVRTVCFSSDNTALLSGSGDSIKIWNRLTQKCIRTINCDYALSAVFLPGDRHCLVGTKSGKLQLFDIGSSAELFSDAAHEGSVWSVCLTPDLRGFASGGSDKIVKFWEFQLSSELSGKQLTTVHTRTFQLDEEVLCIRFSKNYKLIAVSLLDSTVKIFFVDTLKFFLSLHGHKFPVMCMDISDDCTLIATGSSDRNIKLWGLDFGDCHKSIFAHNDAIMCLQFIPKTHMFFTGGKDGCVKQWDGDNFQRIATFKEHHGEVWALAVSPNGKYVASAAHDKSIRLWEKTDDILVLEEEKEMEREEEFDQTLADKDETVIAGEVNQETGLATKRNAENLKAAERVMEGLDIYKEETEKMKEQMSLPEKSRTCPNLHPLMVAYKTPTTDHFILHILKSVKSSELEEALLVLPFSYVMQLLQVLERLLDRGWNVELCCRCLFFLLRVYHNQITTSEALLHVVDKLKTNAMERVRQMRDCLGFNIAGLQCLQKELESKNELRLFLDATQKFNEKMKRKRKKEKLLERTILIMN